MLHTMQFAIKNAFRKKLVASLSIAGIAIGIALMVALSSASAGFDSLLNDTLTKTVGDVQVIEYNKDVPFSQLPADITEIIMTIDDSDKIEAISPEIYVLGFEQFSPNITIHGRFGNADMPFTMISARGIHETNDLFFEGPTTRIIEGRIYENDFEIIVADFIAEGSNVLFDVNNTVSFYINSTYSVSIKIVGLVDTSNDPMAIINPSVIMSVNTGRLLNSLYLPFNQTGYNYVNVRFDSKTLEETQKHANQLEELVPKLAVIITGELLKSTSDLLDNFSIMQTILTIIVVVAGGMAIFVAQLMGVNERMKEFAIMKATGWKNRTILFDIILESLTIGLCGALVGFVLGAGLIFITQLGVAEVFIKITWQTALKVLAMGLGFGIAAGLIPGLRAARVKPMEVIRGL